MLQLILIITLGAPNVAAMERAYTQWLGYSVTERGQVSQDLAAAWNAPAMAGRGYTLVQPESKANIYLRFVQVDAAPNYVPMKTYGWNAIEIMVQDPDGLAERFAKPGSPFSIAGVPRPLGPNSTTRAMQAIGPAKEVLYLTRIPSNPQSTRETAKTYVDRPFIMIVGGPDIEALRNTYRDSFGLTVGQNVNKARVTVLNKAHGLDIETTHPISMARISPQYSIEIDQYPPTATERPVRKGELPPAVAMVAVEVDSLDKFAAMLLAPARAIAAPPYNGRRAGVVRGAAGELFELIETKERAGTAATAPTSVPR